MRPNWKGIFPALSTITNELGELDENAIRSEVRHNIDWGAHGLAASIIAGEFYKFSEVERRKTFDIVVDEANGKVPVLVGVSHTGTELSIGLAKYGEDIGADGIIVMPPYFGRNISRKAIHKHFQRIAASVDLPIMIQDAEDVTGVHMCPTFYMSLMEEYANIVSVKIEGVNTLEKISDVKRLLGNKLIIFGGMAARLIFQELALGADGNIPDACLTDLLVTVYNNIESGNLEKAKEAFARYRRWVDFLSQHPGSSAEVEKETLRLRGVIRSSYTRGPNIPLQEEEKNKLKELLTLIGVLPC
jgi:4-hydroxy-tetrahydrodipicolinate synthase